MNYEAKLDEVNYELRYCFSAKEITWDAGFVHRPSNSEASRNAEDERDKQEDEAGWVELQIGDKTLAEDGEDGGEDVERQAVATEEEGGLHQTSPRGGFFTLPLGGAGGGLLFVNPKQRGYGEIDGN